MKRITVIRVAHMLYALIGLLALSSTALANDVEPALPGSVEYWLTSNNYTWIRTSDPIAVGGYVEDLISDIRWNQPVGRGKVGIVLEIAWDPWPYDQWAAMVDFGRDFSVGIVFSRAQRSPDRLNPGAIHFRARRPWRRRADDCSSAASNLACGFRPETHNRLGHLQPAAIPRTTFAAAG